MDALSKKRLANHELCANIPILLQASTPVPHVLPIQCEDLSGLVTSSPGFHKTRTFKRAIDRAVMQIVAVAMALKQRDAQTGCDSIQLPSEPPEFECQAEAPFSPQWPLPSSICSASAFCMRSPAGSATGSSRIAVTWTFSTRGPNLFDKEDGNAGLVHGEPTTQPVGKEF
jgi:hypothetical protein